MSKRKEQTMTTETLERQTIYIPPGKVRAKENHGRYGNVPSPERVNFIAESISSHGQLQPVIVRTVKDNGDGCTHELLAGFTRHAAATKLGRDLWAEVHEVADDSAALEIAVEDNRRRNELSPLDWAAIYKRWTDRGETLRRVAKRYDCSHVWVGKLVKLLNLPEQVRTVLAGRAPDGSALLSVTAGIALTSLPDDDAVIQCLIAGADPTPDVTRDEKAPPVLRYDSTKVIEAVQKRLPKPPKPEAESTGESAGETDGESESTTPGKMGPKAVVEGLYDVLRRILQAHQEKKISLPGGVVEMLTTLHVFSTGAGSNEVLELAIARYFGFATSALYDEPTK